MKVLMITGDKQLFREGSNAFERLKLQRDAVEELRVVYWGRGAIAEALHVRGQYDVVTSQDPFWRGIIAWHVARKVGASLNVQVHADLSKVSFMKHIVAQIVLHHADTIRVVSDKLKERMERMRVRAKVTVLPVYVDLARFRNVVRRPHAGTQILWAGRFEEEKNPLAAVEVLRSVQQDIPDARLTMLGSGSLKDEITKRAAGLPVELPGWQDPVPYLAEADVVLSTSWHESWGSSIVEALAAGVPVVAPNVGVAKEAGARIAEREKLAEVVAEVLKRGERGVLKLDLLPADEWAVQWRSSLI